MDLLTQGTSFFKKIFSTNKAIKTFKDEFIEATIDWIRPIFLEENKRLVTYLEEGNSEKIDSRLTDTLDDLLTHNLAFKTELERILKEAENHKTNTTNTDNSIGKGATLTNSTMVGGNQSYTNSHNTSNSNNTNTTINHIHQYTGSQIHELLPEEIGKDSPTKNLPPTFFNVKKLLRQDRMSDAIELLADIIEEGNYRSLYEEMITNFSSRWYRLKRKIQSGAISYENAAVAKTTLNSSILSTVNDMKNEI